MNKITEIVAEYMKDAEFSTPVMGRPYEPFQQDFEAKFKDWIEHYELYSQLAPYALYECSEDECLPEAIVNEIVNEIDWRIVKETWVDYNRC